MNQKEAAAGISAAIRVPLTAALHPDAAHQNGTKVRGRGQHDMAIAPHPRPIPSASSAAGTARDEAGPGARPMKVGARRTARWIPLLTRLHALSRHLARLFHRRVRRRATPSPAVLDARATVLSAAAADMAPATSDAAPVAKRISQGALLIVTVVLLCIAEFLIPGGLTPRRVKEQILAKRVAEQLDVISAADPNVVMDGPFPIEKIHRKALVHRGVWMFALDSHLRLLLTWRAPSQKTCPMTWAPVGEHAITNETFEEAARRGIFEEARFIARPRIHPVGAPFFFHHVYRNGTAEERTDNQWTQAYVVLPRGDALDFRTLDDRDAQIGTDSVENTRYQGMSLPDVVKHAVQRPEYFCHSTQVKWMLQVIPLVIRVLKSRDKRLFRGHLRDDWANLVASGSPVCCKSSEHPKLVEDVDVASCGVPCEGHNTDSSDVDSVT